jgi:putative transposase
MKAKGISNNKVYQALGISKQAVHEHIQRSNNRQSLLNNIEHLLVQIRKDHPVLALRTIHHMLKIKGVGRDLFESYFKSIGMGIERKKNYRRTTDSRGVTKFDDLRKGLQLTGINQLWTSDITYYEVSGRFYYITFILDAYSRRIIGYSASKSMSTDDTTLPSLRMAMKKRGINKLNPAHQLIFHSDGGGQYYCKEFLRVLRNNKISSSMAEVVYDNAHAERINGIIKNNYLIHQRINTFDELRKELDRCVKLYNHKRPHTSLGKQTPVEFEEKLISFAKQQKTEGEELIDGKLKKKGASSPISSWQQKTSGSESIFRNRPSRTQKAVKVI